MAENKVYVTVFFGGKFQVGPPLEYVGGRVDVVEIGLNNGLLSNIIEAIEALGVREIEKLFYRVPGSTTLKDGLTLRYLWDNSDVIDLFYHHLRSENIDLYVEHVDDEETGAEMEIGGLYNVIGNIDDDGNQLEVANRDLDEREDDDACNLVDVEQSSDGDDFELVDARRKLKEFSARHRLKSGAYSEVAGTSQTPVVDEAQLVDASGYETEYRYSDDEESLQSGLNNKGDEEVEVAISRRRSRFPSYEQNGTNPVFIIGMTFEDATEFKDAILRYSVAEQRAIKYTKNTKKFVRARCAQKNCNWMIYGAVDSKTGSFHLKKYIDEHICSITFENKRVSSVYLAKHFMILISAMPKINAPELKKLVREQLGVNVTLSQCRRTKLKVLKELQNNYKEGYAQMYDYLGELYTSSPASNFKMKVERPLPDSLPLFDRAYFCFDACMKGFLAGCRKIIRLDGCFLRGLIKGELLCAVGRDANNQMYPVAWAVIRIENKDTWTWFIELLKSDLDMCNGNGWTLISDQQKGLVPSVAELLPNAEHRMCARHIYSNWGQKYKGKQLMRQFWKCAKSTNMSDFEVHRQRLKEMTHQGHDDLFRTEPKHWCKAFFDTNIKCDVIDNNLSKAFNGRCVEARCKAILSMLENIRIMVMNRMHTQRDGCARWTRNYGPRIAHKLHQNTTASSYCHLIWNGDEGYEIMEGGDKYVVDFNLKTCSCRAWELSGIPCCHAICAIHHKRNDPNDYLAECFYKVKYLSAYQFMMPMVRGQKFWEKTLKEAPQPPPMKKMPGRPKRSRRKQPIELVKGDRMTKEGKRMTCSTCNVVGHNSKGCPLKKANAQADVCSSSAHANASTAEAHAQSQANVCSSSAHANASTAEAHAQSQANSIGPRPDKRQAKAKATTSVSEGGSKGQTNASAEASAIRDNSGQANASAQASANVRGCSATPSSHIGCTATADIRGCSGEANAFAKVCFDQGEGIYSAQANVIAQDRPQKILFKRPAIENEMMQGQA
ncbi:uncharacterized protein LOC115667281 isoform X2 [Syzygium oleosum]|uniref:uncharacterized protein LOC115667281 isoform X2 n=1 Tax=Syzygium oleosum TaxID=219896 RepID=UPI0024BABDF7|nr:uncharacterized protein LOC115667281 isoform X2 [Syzygium oleosum]